MLETVDLIPLAMTRVDDESGCLGAMSDSEEWVRPQPVTIARLSVEAGPFRYDHWTTVVLDSLDTPEARPEDRSLVRLAGNPSPALTDRAKRLDRYCDPNVETAFANDRSLGLVEVDVERVYLKRATRGRLYVRAAFADATNVRFDWIVPEIALVDHVLGLLEGGHELQGVDLFGRGSRVFFAIGLTMPNHRLPGRFRGCHPLVVGVHSVPDYLEHSNLETN